jgi:hypothetical protein
VGERDLRDGDGGEQDGRRVAEDAPQRSRDL